MEVSVFAAEAKGSLLLSLVLNFSHRWAASIDNLFLQHGLKLLSHQRLPIVDEMKKPWTDIGITAAGETIKQIIIPSCKEGEDPTPEKWLQLLEGFILEMHQNQQCQTVDMIVTVGRKPLS